MKIEKDSYTGLLVDSDQQCICHQASGDSSNCPYHYPKPTIDDMKVFA